MKFRYSAYIENTLEMREWLNKVGIITLEKKVEYSKYTKYIVAQNGMYLLLSDYLMEELCLNWEFLFKDCLNNPNLFKAITAIRSDSDYMQWFIITRYNQAKDEIVDEWRLSNTDKFEIDSMPYGGIISHHKATNKELEERFKQTK